MSYSFSKEWKTKKELVDYLIRPFETEQYASRVIAHRVVRSELWMVREFVLKVVPSDHLANGVVAPEGTLAGSSRKISVALLKSTGRRRGSSEHTWGYKEITEAEHPFYYSCPLKFLEITPCACREWRDNVQAYHAEDNETPTWKAFAINDIVEVYGQHYTLIAPLFSTRNDQRLIGWGMIREQDQKTFRLSGKSLKAARLVKKGEELEQQAA